MKRKTKNPVVAIAPATHAALVAHCKARGMVIKVWTDKVINEALKKEGAK